MPPYLRPSPQKVKPDVWAGCLAATIEEASPTTSYTLCALIFRGLVGMINSMEAANLPADVLADMQRAIELAMTGKQDPEFATRVQRAGKRIRDEVFHKHGLLDIAVSAVRELRDNE
jgi:hypothetical protein